VEPGRSIVLRGGVPIADKPAPYDFTWAFVVLDDPARPTRLVRERYADGTGGPPCSWNRWS
jgi:hypothetical protein